MNTCDRCKFWKYNNENILGSCSSSKFIYDGDVSYADLQKDALYYGDYGGYSASFETAPKFGCIHFENKVKK